MHGEPRFDIKSILFGLSLEPVLLNSDKKEIVINSDQAKITLTDDILIYSCIIPFNMITNKPSKKKNIALGLFSGSVKNSSEKGPDNKSMAGNRPRGMNGGTPPSGGMGGGPNMGGGAPGMGGGRPSGGEMPSNSDRPSKNDQEKAGKSVEEWFIFSKK